MIGRKNWCRLRAGTAILLAGFGTAVGAHMPAPSQRDRLPPIVMDWGVPLSASEYAGKPLLVNFWASWCVPCQKELPSLDRLAARRSDLAIIAVSVDSDRRDGLRAFMGHYPHLRLGYAAMRAVQAYGALGIPYSVTFDRRGREIARVPRALAWDSDDALPYLPAPDRSSAAGRPRPHR